MTTRWAALGLGLLAFVGSLALYARPLDYPHDYHPRGARKAQQVATGERNFHHPLLMLEAPAAALALSGRPRTAEAAAAWILRFNALSAAVAVAAFAWLAFLLGGLAAGAGAAILCVLTPWLHLAARYPKEDAALLAGVALSLLAMTVAQRHASPANAAWLGFATAWAASAKYVGIALLPLALLVAARPPRGRAARIGLLGATFLCAFLIVNHRWLGEGSALRAGLANETLAALGQAGYSQEQAWRTHLELVVRSVPNLLWALAAAYVGILVVTRHRGRMVEAWILASFPGLWAVLLLLSSKTGVRYVLPIQITVTVMAALGAVELARLSRFRDRRLRGAFQALAVGLAVAAVAPSQARVIARHASAFATDPRADLARWVASHLPRDAVVAYGPNTHLGRVASSGEVPPLPQRILEIEDPWSFTALRAEGVSHVALAATDYKFYLQEGIRVGPDHEEEYRNRRGFLMRLLQEGQLLFQQGGQLVIHPTVRLYALEAASARAPD